MYENNKTYERQLLLVPIVVIKFYLCITVIIITISIIVITVLNYYCYKLLLVVTNYNLLLLLFLCWLDKHPEIQEVYEGNTLFFVAWIIEPLSQKAIMTIK